MYHLKRISNFVLASAFFGLFMLSNAYGTVYFHFNAEGYNDGDGVPIYVASGPKFCQTECGSGGETATIQSSGGAPQGGKYWQWHIQPNQVDARTEITNKGVFPLYNVLGKTFYYAAIFKIERINGNDVFHEGRGIQSANKFLELVGTNIRWSAGIGQWSQCNGSDSWAANNDGYFFVHGGNATYHLNPEFETYTGNMNGFSCNNPPQLAYDTWHSVVFAVKIETDSTGFYKLWWNGTQITERLNIRTSAGESPSITRMQILGTIAQPAYDAPEHYVKMDNLMLADDWQDIVDGGYLAGAPTGGVQFSNPGDVNIKITWPSSGP